MADDTTQTGQWRGQPRLAWAVRVAIFVVPFAAAMTVAFLLSSLLPAATTILSQIVRWLAIVAVSTVAMMGVDRVARRLLPLSVLLKLTLVFPDHAPSRFGVAMRTGTTSQLRERIEAARRVPSGETPQEAAERLLELVGLLSHHDRLTRGHSERVRAYSHLIGEELGLTGSELDKLRWAALLHDVGKTAIDPAILNKPGALTAAEFDKIKTHPDEGRALVAPLADWLGESIQAVWQHHERFDGRGYPQGLSGTEIAFAARVVTVADSYDVMTSARSYKKPMSAEAARAELATCSGTQFDPIMVRAFLNVSLGRLRMMTGPLAWFAQLALFEPSGVVHATATSAQLGGSGSAVSSAGASTATAAAASTGTAGVASTVAVTAASVVASAVGIAAATPIVTTPVEAASAPITQAAQVDYDDLPAPQDTVLELDNGSFGRSGRNATEQFTKSTPVSTTGDAVETPAAPADDTGPSTTVAAADAVANGSGTTLPSPVASTTTAAPAATPAATTTTTVAPRTTPLPPATTARPTTSSTPTTPATTTTLPPTTTTTLPRATTTTTTTTTTTLPQVTAPTLYLGGGVTGNIPAPAFHGIFTGAPPDIGLPNFDTDRDAAPGALVQKGAAGINGNDPTKLLKFRGSMNAPYVINGDLHVDLYVAAKDFAKKNLRLELGVYRCNASNQCVLLDSDVRTTNNADKWRSQRFHFHATNTVVGAGESIEMRVAVLDSSEDDAWFAFGTKQYDSKITVDSDGDSDDDSGT